MKIKFSKNYPVLKYFTNTYVLIFTLFIIWMIFFDKNSYLTHRKINKEIKELEKSIEVYQSEIKEDKKLIEKLQDSLQLERFAREKYLLKKDNEDIYIIEFDSVNKP